MMAVIFGQTSSILCPKGSVEGMVPATCMRLSPPILRIEGVSNVVVISLNRKAGEIRESISVSACTARSLFNSVFEIKLTSILKKTVKNSQIASTLKAEVEDRRKNMENVIPRFSHKDI